MIVDPADLPFVDDYLLCKNLGWTWEACQRTPTIVKQAFLLYHAAEEAARPKPGE